MTAIIPATATPLALSTFGAERLQLIKDTICRGSSDQELELFATICQRTGLDPFARQIYAIKRWDAGLKREAMVTQVSIDGARLVAARSGEYAGQTEPLWCGPDGQWRDVWLAKTPPAAAKVGVYRRGFSHPVYHIATWAEYAAYTRNGDLTSMWAKFGPTMLAKCAESGALRKAFPAELSGLYTREEMQQADSEPAPAEPQPLRAVPPVDVALPAANIAPVADLASKEATGALAVAIQRLLKAGFLQRDIQDEMERRYSTRASRNLTTEQAQDFTRTLEILFALEAATQKAITAGWKRGDIEEYRERHYRVKSSAELSDEQAQELTAYLLETIGEAEQREEEANDPFTAEAPE